MRFGISTACLYPMRMEESLGCLLGMGFRRFEIFLNTFSETTEEYLSPLCKKLKAANAEVISIHPFTSAFENMLFFSDYSRRTEDSLQFYHCFFRAACQLGAKFLVLHGQRNYQKGRITEEQYLENYHRLFLEGQKFGITVAQENVVAFRSERPEFIKKMRLELQDDCAFVLDIKQAVRAGESPMEMYRAMGNRLVHLHLNDHLPGKDCLLPGRGGFDFKTLFADLHGWGYPGDGIIEVYRENFREAREFLDSMEYLVGIQREIDEKKI